MQKPAMHTVTGVARSVTNVRNARGPPNGGPRTMRVRHVRALASGMRMNNSSTLCTRTRFIGQEPGPTNSWIGRARGLRFMEGAAPAKALTRTPRATALACPFLGKFPRRLMQGRATDPIIHHGAAHANAATTTQAQRQCNPRPVMRAFARQICACGPHQDFALLGTFPRTLMHGRATITKVPNANAASGSSSGDAKRNFTRITDPPCAHARVS